MYKNYLKGQGSEFPGQKNICRRLPLDKARSQLKAGAPAAEQIGSIGNSHPHALACRPYRPGTQNRQQDFPAGDNNQKQAQTGLPSKQLNRSAGLAPVGTDNNQDVTGMLVGTRVLLQGAHTQSINDFLRLILHVVAVINNKR